MKISIDKNGNIQIGEIESNIKSNNRNKGKSLDLIPDNYTIIDLETTGLDPGIDNIIEIAVIKVRNNNIVDEWSSLIRPDVDDQDYIDPWITSLTGITNEMLENKPTFSDISKELLLFIGKDNIAAHNAHFDINFLYDNFLYYEDYIFDNNFIDTLKLSRRLLPKLKNHKLNTLANFFNINIENHHRALEDCYITQKCIIAMKQYSIKNNISFEDLIPKSNKYVSFNDITTDNFNFNKEHPLYNKNCCFTGKLEKLVRKDAAQLVADLGGIPQNNVTLKTNFLILGNLDYVSNMNGKKSSKQLKAEKLILDGQDLQIINEDVFYDMIFDV